MTDERLQQLYQQAMARRAAEPGGCQISPDTMLDVLTHKLPEPEHRRTMLAILSDPRCQREFDLLRAVAGVTQRSRTSWMTGWPVRIAAVLVLFVGGGIIWQTLRTPPPDVGREGGNGAGILTLVSPESGAGAPGSRQFIWRVMPGALSYEYTLVTRGGRLLYTATTRDTALSLPDTVQMKNGEDLRWWIEATTADGRQVRSTLRRLRIVSP